MKNEIYVSVDIETDGPIPGPHSMLEIGAAAFSAKGEPFSYFHGILKPLEGAAPHPETLKWWTEEMGPRYQYLLDNGKDPAQTMINFAAWVATLPGIPVFVAYPAGFDFTFVYWYLRKFAGHSPFSFSALDIKTFAMATMKKRLGYRGATKKNMPKSWFPIDIKHTHCAIDDAIEQGMLFLNILRANEELHDKAWRYEQLD
jgi:DNA polymerase III alpha subunit (gram-positive type)